ncbi:MAG: hypothetical protein QHJ34_02290 [bacterium]|jgi:uncharacterized OB-fold protein|nr:hypothetical protein [candidate division KSB1 bacterium]MDH7559047.1 hypothetical protein [bacterium]
MGKDRSFATKVAKAKMEFGKRCPKCGELLVPHVLVVSEQRGRSGAWRFTERVVGVCKCTQKEVLG